MSFPPSSAGSEETFNHIRSTSRTGSTVARGWHMQLDSRGAHVPNRHTVDGYYLKHRYASSSAFTRTQWSKTAVSPKSQSISHAKKKEWLTTTIHRAIYPTKSPNCIHRAGSLLLSIYPSISINRMPSPLNAIK
ncbi:predicted protein [Plenodomus lingam JN3]|uniref:Predicted protein n=1 Tax=Leptosphaeria maculans (strain JN3 / isolate v23.1.3 / race Av1-4-5-6-7-8) TaxID=985895 RepID=E4ZIR0_LEPMJ|nr:predicted protein [Plenodomus lingam JN3]CBX91081.1 predicted protein [Plenodomus lingam JN3]